MAETTQKNTDIRLCASCKKRTVHNGGKKEGTERRWRCTYCGHPITTTNDGKKSHQEALKKRQVDKIETRRKLGLDT